jgi:hypothetical protein
VAESLSAADSITGLLELSLAHLLPAMVRLSNEALSSGVSTGLDDTHWEESSKLLCAVAGALPCLLGLLRTGEREDTESVGVLQSK